MLTLEEETYRIRGAAYEVYKELGCGFLEAVFQESMEKELTMCGVPFQSQPELGLFYKDSKLKQIYKPDFICFDSVIVELKAVTKLVDEHRAQVHNYLKATGLKVGLLINFLHYPKAEIERIIR